MALGKTVEQLLREISSSELCEWRAYYQLEPFGELIADQRHGIATSVLANVNRDITRAPEPYKPTDFIYWHEANRNQAAHGGVLLADPEAQSQLIKQKLFKAAR